MEYSEILFLIIGSLFFLFGVAITIFPNELERWLHTHSIRSVGSIYFAGYIIGFIGLAILVTIFLG
ncbi:MAG: hypothetical protein APR54_02455 [Candidatus Cloacimonas sp. SDB]|nr:MAG: hypothetical protein APR54_02455 [Candidatus Cloacimonas sp. SDB]